MLSEANQLNAIGSNLLLPWQNNQSTYNFLAPPSQLNTGEVSAQILSSNPSNLLGSSALSKADLLATSNIATSNIDLLIDSLTTSTPLIPAGKTVSFSYNLSNQGISAASGSSTDYYLSNNNTYDPTADTLIGTDTVGSLPASSSLLRSNSLNISSTIQAGDYWLFAVADNKGQISEADETNNVSPALPLTITKPELSITNLVAPSNLVAGGSFNISYTLNNTGTGTAAANTTRYYLSAGGTPDPTKDILLSWDTVATLGANSRVNRTTAGIRVPSNLAAGNYSLYAMADGSSQVAEMDETNNITIAGTVALTKSDLTISNLLVGSTLVAGGVGSIGYTINNNGNGAAASSYTRYYLSTSTVLDPTKDILIGTEKAPVVGANSSTNFTSASGLRPPGNMAPGNYFLYGVADATAVLPESDETNNITAPVAITVTKPELSITNLIAPSNLVVGGSFNISYTLNNTGTGTAAANTTRYYLSTGGTPDPTKDLLLSWDTVATLGANSRVNRTTAGIRVPSNLAAGNYALYAMADGSSQVAEMNETNNITMAGTVALTESDLTISNLLVGSTLVAGGVGSIGYTINNNGNGAAASSYTRYYLSTSTVLDPTKDILIGTEKAPVVGANSSTNFTSASGLRPPGNMAPGNYFLYGVADATAVLPESDETNNITAPVAITVTKPELSITNLIAPSNLVVGGSFNISYTLNNTGTGTAAANTTRYYLSTGGTPDPTKDLLLSWDTVATLGANSRVNRTTAGIRVPSNLAAGNYALYAMADGSSQVAEMNETNNITMAGTVALTKCDLTISNLTTSGQYVPGNTVSISYTLNNLAAGVANSSITRYYLSKSSAFNPSTDILIGSDTAPAIGANAIVNRTTASIRLPSTLEVGTYSLYAIADATGIVSESNEINNITGLSNGGNIQNAGTVTVVKPDLTIANLTAPSILTAGNTANFSYTLVNQGLGNALPSTTRYYLSTDNSFVPSEDILIGFDNAPALGVNSSVNRTGGLNLPKTLAVGDYYLYAVADGAGLVPETNETNNIDATGVNGLISVVKPDLSISALTAPSILAPGGTVNISYSLRNFNSGNAAASTTRYYLSNSNTFNPAADILLGSDSAPALAANSSTTRTSINLRVPPTLATGVYNLYAVSDATGAIVETDENNNMTSMPSSILLAYSDLSVSGISASATVNTGARTNISYTLANLTAAPASSTTTFYYLSKDAVFDQTDILAGSKGSSALLGNNSTTETGTIVIDNNVAEGNYFLFVVGDGTKQVMETDESNNLAFAPLTITRPDVSIGSVTVNGNLVSGVAVGINYSLANQGSGQANPSTTKFYLSADANFDLTSDVLVGSVVTSGVAANSTATGAANITVPQNLSIGNYYLFGVADSTAQLIESNENNNLSAATPVNVAQIDLAIGNLVTPTTLALNSSLIITYNLSNVGNAVSGSTTTQFYLSTNSTLDSSDVLLSTDSAPGVSIGQTMNRSATAIINTSITPGSYYIIGVANGSGTIPEANKTNNIVYTPITVTASDLDNGAGFNSKDGYGLVNAAAAVAQAIGQDPFPELPPIGGNAWNQDLINAPEVWARNYTGQGITVAVIDTGVNINHADLAANIWVNRGEIPGDGIDNDGNGFIDDVNGWNFPDNNNNLVDGNGHGTHVAGIIGALRNSIGNTGIAPNVKIMPIKVLGGQNIGTSWDVAQGIRYAANNGAKVINMSLGGSFSMPSVEQAITYAASRGVTVVMAAGNSSGSVPIYPAYYALTNGIAVGAVGSTNNFQGFSNKAGTNSSMAYVTAPGAGILSTMGSGYGGMSGTSMASPHVAGVVALMLSANPNLTPAQVRQIITSSATHTVLAPLSLDPLNYGGTGSQSSTGLDLPSDFVDVLTISQ
jgi:subtilase family serine protease